MPICWRPPAVVGYWPKIGAMKLTGPQIADACSAFARWLRFRAMMSDVPSVAYGISHRDRNVLAGALGVANLSSGAPALAERTGYRVASITKTFTATMVMQLADQGKLRLDDPVSAHLSWLPSAFTDSGITLRHLLTHSGGVIRDGSGAWGDDDLPDQAALRRDVTARPTFAGPSVGFRYSNVAYALLGEIVEQITKQSYAEAIEARILAPTGMRSSGTRLTPPLRRNLATGYWSRRPGEPYQATPATEARAFEPAGGLISTVPDLLQYQQAHFLGDHRLVSDLSKREMQRTQWQRGVEPHHGYGWMLWTVDGARLCGHSGGYAGFNTRIGFDPEQRIAAVVLMNTLGTLPELAVDGFFHILSRVQSLWDASVGGGSGMSRAQLGKLEGQYRGPWGEWLVIRIRDRLYLADSTLDRPFEEAARLNQVQGTARFVIADHEDYGYRGEEVDFSLDPRGIATKLQYGPHTYLRADV